MKALVLVLLAGSLARPAAAQAPALDEIMSRVARNQAKTLDLRTSYIYTQTQLLRMVRGGGKVAREERREYLVTPKDRGIAKKLAGFQGKYESHGQYVSYDRPGYHYKGLDLDGDLLNSFSEDMTNDKDSRDGIGHDLFPLTYHQQLKYDFKLVGEETRQGRRVYRVSFEPKTKHGVFDDGGTIWKGEALIDAEEFQPVQVTTKMAVKLPLAVKTLLGTNISGLGFAVSYRQVADGVWFPVSYGGEFEFRGLFFYKRSASISMRNLDFRRADVTSDVMYAGQ